MKKQLLCFACALVTLTNLMASLPAAAQYAIEVVSYDAGTTPATEFGSGLPFNVPAAALGEPSRFISDPSFPGVVSPFNGPYKRDQLLSVGEGGQVTLRLSNFALPQGLGPEIGVFGHASLIDVAYPGGQAGSPASAFGVDEAMVEVSADGSSWVSLGSVTFALPTNGYSDVVDPFAVITGSVTSDFQQPFMGGLSSFNGLKYYDAGGPDILEVLAGSGGGTWLDISGTGLA
jgi:hypothetical protein